MSLNDLDTRPTKQLLIIGNGFDKHLGLKSTYAEYYSSLSDDERKNNIFTFLASDENYNWIDVELLLLKCLTIINKFELDNVRKYIYSTDSHRKDDILYDMVFNVRSPVCKTISEEKKLTAAILEYLSQSMEITWSMSKMSVNNIRNNFMTFMMEQVKNFESGFKDYLNNEIINFPRLTYDIKSRDFIDKLIKSGVSNTDEYCNFILSFNYTHLPNSTDLFYSRVGNNVHGTL